MKFDDKRTVGHSKKTYLIKLDSRTENVDFIKDDYVCDFVMEMYEEMKRKTIGLRISSICYI